VPLSKDALHERIANQLPPEPVSSSPTVHPAARGETVDLKRLIEIVDDERFVLEAYRQILGRECDVNGYVHYTQMLRSGVSRQVVAGTLIHSQEAKDRGIQVKGSLASFQRSNSGLSLWQRAQLTALGTARSLVRNVFHAPIEALERKMEFRMQEILDRQARLESQTESLLQNLRQELYTILPRRAVAFPGGQNVLVTEVDGLILGVPGEEWRMAAYLALRGPMEPGLTKRFLDTVRPGMTVVDVGANIGWYTLKAAQRVGAGGKVIAFEPAPRTFSILKDNVQVNGLLETGIVELKRMACGAGDGEAELWIYPDDSGHNTLAPPEPDTGADSGVRPVRVPVTSLDRELEHLAAVNVVKIDAEGWEPHVIEGMQELLHRSPVLTVFLEFAPLLLKRAGTDPAAFLTRLRSIGALAHVDDVTGDSIAASEEALLACHSANLVLQRGEGS
jgi:FkbM family methyltransferase